MSDKKSKKSSGFFKLFIIPFLIMGLYTLIPIIFTIKNGEPIYHAIPYTLLFTGFRNETKAVWKMMATSLQDLPVSPPEHIPVIEAKDYSFDKLREVTDGFMNPVVVRGLFADVPGVQNWGKYGYLNQYLGSFDVPVVRGALLSSTQNNKTVQKFADTMNDIMTNDKEKSYMFFPMKNRPTKKHYDANQDTFAVNAEKQASDYAKLTKAVNDVVLNDLHIDKKIWPGFGTPNHKKYLGAQFVIGMGSNDTELTTGSGWHCAIGSNFFVQVVGQKRWYFMHPKHSYLFQPLRIGVVAFMANDAFRGWGKLRDHLPIRYVDLQPGDMLYNPDYQWHTIKNYEGLTIGVPIREFNITYSFRNNLLFSSVAMSNKLFEKVAGVTIGGFPEEVGDA